MFDAQSHHGAEEITSTTTLKQGKPRENLFGRDDLAEVYRKAKDLIVEHGIFRMVVVEEEGDTHRVTICNSWRIERHPDGHVVTLEHRFTNDLWEEVTKLEYWPAIPLAPLTMTRSLGWWREVVIRAIYKALIEAGYLEVINYHDPIGNHNRESENFSPEMGRHKMADILITRYIGKRRRGGTNPDEDWHQGFLTNESMKAGARALRAALFDHVLTPDLMSAILAMQYKIVTITDYIWYARQHDDVLRIAKERRNLLPLLPWIAREKWKRQDLFSRKLWVKNGRKRTQVDYAAFNAFLDYPSSRFRSFESAAAFRWLSKAPLTVVRCWAAANFGGNKDLNILENIAQANISVHIPAMAWCHLVKGNRQIQRLGVHPSIQQLFRVFANHCAALWKDQGFAKVKAWLRSNQADLGDIMDWLLAEGIAQGHPMKNATFTSLLRHSANWHERIALESIDRSIAELISWKSLIPVTVIDGITFTPLTSNRELALEGFTQHHCVGTYADDCLRGNYSVFTVVEPDGIRSTLGLWFTKGQWRIEQHRGKYNGQVSTSASQAANKLLELYRHEFASKTRKSTT